MPDLDEVKEQVNELSKASKWLGKKEINELPDILWEDEEIERIVQGIYDSGNGILVATDERLVFVDKGLVYGLTVEDFAYDKVNSIQSDSGLVWGGITIFSSGNKAEIKQVAPKDMVNDFCDHVRKIITEKEEESSEKGNNEDTSVADEIKKLNDLKEEGILTEEEFEEKKKELLNQ